MEKAKQATAKTAAPAFAAIGEAPSSADTTHVMRWIVMAKQPVAGRVKTRLCPPLTPVEAAAVYEALLAGTLRAVARGLPGWGDELVLCYTPGDAREVFWRDYAEPLPVCVELLEQADGDLGQRLAAAHKATPGPSLFLGGDAPDVPDSYLAAVREAVLNADVVLGPSSDGGYWCLGLQPQVDAAALLAEIPWSSGQEYEATHRAAIKMGLKVALVPTWDDVDRFDDLVALHRRRDISEQAAWVVEHLRQRAPAVVERLRQAVEMP